MSERTVKLKEQLNEEIKNYKASLELCRNALLFNWMKTTLDVIEKKVVENKIYDASDYDNGATLIFNDLASSIGKEIDLEPTLKKVRKIIEEHKKYLFDLFRSQIDYVINEIDTLLQKGFIQEENICNKDFNTTDFFVYCGDTKPLRELKTLLKNLKLSDDLSKESLPFILDFITSDYCFLDEILYEIKNM